MMKLLTIFVIACVCLLEGSAQDLSPQNRQICEQLNRQCLLEQPRLGRRDVVTRSIDQQCRRSDRQWRKISRCELERAACIITLSGCGPLTCAQISRVLRR